MKLQIRKYISGLIDGYEAEKRRHKKNKTKVRKINNAIQNLKEVRK